jgi:hypothetical protein
VFVWLETRAVNKLAALRGLGDDYGAMIIRLAAG